MAREPDYWLNRRTKNEIWKMVKGRKRSSMTENRRVKRSARRRIREGTINELVTLDKPGKFVSTMFNSSGAFKSAYSFARSEAEFYDMARYADY